MLSINFITCLWYCIKGGKSIFLDVPDRGNIRNPYTDIYNNHTLPHFGKGVEILELKLKIIFFLF